MYKMEIQVDKVVGSLSSMLIAYLTYNNILHPTQNIMELELMVTNLRIIYGTQKKKN